MKKIVSCCLLLVLCLLTACSGLPKETYTYETQDELSVSVEKTKVYEDKIVVYFSKGAFSGVEEVRCYNADFDYIADDATFVAKDDVLTVYSSHPDKISGMKITVNDYLYYQIRYLDSDAYAMLQGDWADDYGYFVSGDEDAYYTEAEKEKQKQLQEERLEERNRAFAMVEGTWDSDDKLKRIVVSDVESPTIEVYEYREGGWNLTNQIIGYWVSKDLRQEPLCVSIEESKGYSMLYDFYMSEDLMSFECSLIEGNFHKVVGEAVE